MSTEGLSRGQSNRWLGLYAGGFFLPTAFLLFPDAVPASHTLTFVLSLIGISIASACAFIALVRFHAQQSTSILFIGLAYLGESALILLHFLIMAELGVEPEFTSHDRLLFWSAYLSAVYLSGMLMLSQVPWRARPALELRRRSALFYRLGLIAIPALYLLVIYARLPGLDSSLGPIHTPYALLPAGLFAIALFMLWRNTDRQESGALSWFALAFAIKAGSFLFLMGGSEQRLDGLWRGWQLMLVISDGVMLVGLLGSVFELYRKSELQTNRLAVQTAALTESEGFARAVLANAPLGILTASGDGFVLSANPVAARAFDEPEGTDKRSDIREYFAEGSLAEVESMFRNTVESGETQVLRKLARGVHASGHEFPVSITVVCYPSSESAMLSVFVRDLTEVLRQEERTQATLGLQQAVLDNAPAMIVTTDDKGVVTSFNREAALATGYDPEEVLNERFAVFRMEREPSPVDEFDVFTARALDTGADLRNCFAAKKDGGTLDVEVAITALKDRTGVVTGYLMLGTDITKRREAERVKTEFISTVSHELRTPLTSIRGALGLFTQADPKLSLQEANLIQIAHRNVERLILLINDLLDMDKLEAGKMSFKLNRHELGPLVNAAVTAAEGQAMSRSIKISKTGVAEGIWVHLDSHRFLQVMSNLLSNAIKFSPEKATIEVRVIAGEKMARVEVRDFGDGIPAEKQKFLFQKFFQADSSDRRSHGGTGLGLSICKMIVERLNGKISFKSEPGQTTFVVELPSVSAPMAISTSSDALRILIIEDDPDASAILARILGEAGFSVDIASNGAAAKQLLERGRYDCITLDMLLPDQDGPSLLADIRSTPGSRDIPVITVSVVDPGEATAHAVMQVSDWQTKPIAADRLIGSVRRAIERHPGLKVLHVEDDLDTAELVAHILKGVAPVRREGTFADAKAALESDKFALVLLDILLPDGSGYDLLPILKEKHGGTPIIILSSKEDHGDAAQQVATVLSKTRISSDELVKTIRDALGEGKRPDADTTPIRGPHERILVVDDDPAAAKLLELLLVDLGRIDRAGTLAEARVAVKEHSYSLVLLDLGLPDGDGRDLLPLLNSSYPDTPVMILTGREDEESGEWGSVPILNKSQTADEELLAVVKQTLDAWRASERA